MDCCCLRAAGAGQAAGDRTAGSRGGPAPWGTTKPLLSMASVRFWPAPVAWKASDPRSSTPNSALEKGFIHATASSNKAVGPHFLQGGRWA